MTMRNLIRHLEMNIEKKSTGRKLLIIDEVLEKYYLRQILIDILPMKCANFCMHPNLGLDL